MNRPIAVIGIDPSLKNTAVALVRDDITDRGQLIIVTRHIKELIPGTYTRVINELRASIPGEITCGFVEDFSNIGGGDTNKTAIKAVSHSGGMAEEAVVAAGIPMQPITVNQWRRLTLGAPPPTKTKKGTIRSYWTKGDTKYGIPNNITPKLLNIIGMQMGLHNRVNAYDKLDQSIAEAVFLNDKVPENVQRYVAAKQWISEHGATSRRIQIVFGVSLDELEAAAIALAGYTLVKQNKIEGLNLETQIAPDGDSQRWDKLN